MFRQMEKLIELLNEYENQLDWKGCTRSEQPNFIGHIKAVSEYSDDILYNADLSVTSKRYGFIKWLVDNEKIDLDACEGEKTYNNLTASRDSNYTQYERLLMALAIQDEPIEFLVSILK